MSYEKERSYQPLPLPFDAENLGAVSDRFEAEIPATGSLEQEALRGASAGGNRTGSYTYGYLLLEVTDGLHTKTD